MKCRIGKFTCLIPRNILHSIRLPCLHMSETCNVFCTKAYLINCNSYRIWKPNGCTYHHHKGSCRWLHITTPSFKSPAHHTITTQLQHAMPEPRLNRHGKAQRDCFTIQGGREGLAHASPREKDGGMCVCVCDATAQNSGGITASLSTR